MRAGEIAAWLASHPEVTGFAILDDNETSGRSWRSIDDSVAGKVGAGVT